VQPRGSEVEPSAVAAVRSLARLARLAECALDDLSLAHYRVLSAVASGNERASRVAAKLSLGKPTVSASLEALSRRGLIARSPAGDDLRAKGLNLTREGHEVLRRADHALVDRLLGLCGDAEEARRVVEVLVTLGTAVEAEAPRATATRAGDPSVPAT
jgi:DNA-binding MarR family transcriptional regulator